jgi:thiamine-monophosphate kinase
LRVNEAEFIAALRGLPLHPGAQDLRDDAAVIEIGGEALVLTHDAIAEGVHYRAGTDPADIAWKLVTVNLSDLAAKAAEPIGVLIGATLVEGAERFVAGLGDVLDTYGVKLLGGDTIAHSGSATFGCTAIGRATVRPVPARAGAQAGDALYLTGAIGAAMLGFEAGDGAAYLRPRPRLVEGLALGGHVHAMMDVSDGLLIDAWRMAVASGLEVTIALDAVPLSAAYRAYSGDVLAAVTAGDDYQLLCALAPDQRATGHATCIGSFAAGKGLVLTRDGALIPVPERLGFEHRA